MSTLRPIHWVAGVTVVSGVVIALALPMNACRSGERFVDHTGQPGGGPTCMTSYDTGYRPHGWLPIKITAGVGGAVVAVVILLWPKRRLVAIGILIASAAIATAWFIPNGYVQTMRDGHPVCCGEEIDRGWLRTAVFVGGSGIGAFAVLVGLLHRSRPLHPGTVRGARIT
jgi:hypothetical protein